MSKKNKFNIIFFNIILISTLHSATDYANDDNDENIVRMLNETIQENVISKMNCEIFDNNNIQKLADFLNKTNNQCYKNLKFYQIDYNTKKDISERWSFRHIHKKSPSEENRSGSLVNHFNQSNDFNFAQSFFFVILLSEAGYVLNEEASLDKKANDELSRILDTLPVLAPCANNHISWTKKLILVPDFYILFDQRTDIETLLNTDLPPFQERKNTIFFSGAISGWPHPFTMENIQNIPRFHLLDYADTHEFIEYKMTNSNHLTKEHITNPEVIEWFNEKHSNKAARQCNYIDHAQYKYLLSFDGFGAAWGRIPSILSSGSVLLMQSECNQWFYSRLKAYDPFTAEAPILDENFIIVSRDLSNLEDLYNWLEANPEQAEQLGKNGKKLASNFFRTESNFNYLLQTLQQVKKRHSIFYLNNMHHKDLIYTITKKIAN
jgi:hypothetical protein